MRKNLQTCVLKDPNSSQSSWNNPAGPVRQQKYERSF